MRERGEGRNTGLTGQSAEIFSYGDHSGGTDPQHAGGIANATPVDGHVDHLVTNLKYAAAILVLAKEDAPGALLVVTLRGYPETFSSLSRLFSIMEFRLRHRAEALEH